MNESQREHIGRIITGAFHYSKATAAFELENVLSEFSKAGRTGGGMTVVAGGKKLSRLTDLLVGELATKIVAVSRTADAFEELSSAMRQWIRICQDDLRAFVDRAKGVRLQDQGETLMSLANDEIAKIQKSVDLRLAVEEMEFCQSLNVPQVASTTRPKKVGRPSSEFWDDMWAAIATALYVGDLKPKSQADVVRAMTEWVEANGHSAAESTIKTRARRLWDGIEAFDE